MISTWARSVEDIILCATFRGSTERKSGETTHMERPLGAALTRWLPESPLFQPLDSSRTASQTHLPVLLHLLHPANFIYDLYLCPYLRQILSSYERTYTRAHLSCQVFVRLFISPINNTGLASTKGRGGEGKKKLATWRTACALLNNFGLGNN